MITVTDEIIERMVDAIVREVAPERVYLFGSRARGEARADSDVDILIIESEGFGRERSRLNETNRVYRALSGFRIPKDILVYSNDEYVNWRGSRNHVIGRCESEGRLLYARHQAGE